MSDRINDSYYSSIHRHDIEHSNNTFTTIYWTDQLSPVKQQYVLQFEATCQSTCSATSFIIMPTYNLVEPNI